MFHKWRAGEIEIKQLLADRDRTRRDLQQIVRWIKALLAGPGFVAQLIYKVESVIKRMGDDE